MRIHLKWSRRAYFQFMTAPQSSKRILERESSAPLPGTKYSYSSTGYIALGFIIEKAARISYASYLRKTIFTPAGMMSSGVLGADKAPLLATGYNVSTTWAQKLPGFRIEVVGEHRFHSFRSRRHMETADSSALQATF